MFRRPATRGCGLPLTGETCMSDTECQYNTSKASMARSGAHSSDACEKAPWSFLCAASRHSGSSARKVVLLCVQGFSVCARFAGRATDVAHQ
eukprot:4476184-Pyramimonas_sp.AAC.1